jgi:hypothetical protein
MSDLVTCNSCGWVHFAVTRQYAEEQVKSFNDFFDGASNDVKVLYGSPVTMRHYSRCAFCGGPHTNFRPFREGDCPDGCTIAAIISEAA